MLKVLPLSLRSLVRNRRRSVITLIAIAMGVAVVVFANGFGNGFVTVMIEMTVNVRTGALQVHRKGYMDANEMTPLKLDMPYDEAIMEKIRTTPGVKAVAPRIRFGGLVSNGVKSSMVLGQGFDPKLEVAVCPWRPTEVEGLGRHLDAAVTDGAVVGGELAKSFDVKPGGTLTVTASGREGGINALDMTVLGVTRGAVPFESKRLISVPLPFAQELTQMEGRVTEYGISVHDLKAVPAVAEALRARLGDEYEVSSWADVVTFLRDAVNRLRIILNGVSAVLFLIVVFGVVNTMLMSVYERVREIGTMLAIGMRRRQVMWLFLLEAMTLGAVGGLLGAAFGYAINSYFASTGVLISPPGTQFQQLVRPDTSPQVAVAAVVVSMLGGLLAAAWPARKAAKMNPVDALRTV